MGTVGMDTFNEIFNSVCVTGNYEDEESRFLNSRKKTMQFLDSIGFCELDFSNRMVYVCPPTLVSIPSYGMPTAILVGARTNELIDKLKSAVKKRGDKTILYIQRNEGGSVPDLIKLIYLSDEVLKEISTECGIGSAIESPAAWNLVNFSSAASEMERKLKFEQKPEPQNTECNIFSCEELKFVKNDRIRRSDQFGLVEYISSRDKQRRYWLWKGDMAAEVDRNWGIYLILKLENKNVILYDYKTNKMGICTTTPLPILLARAVSLCSGLVPNQVLKSVPEINPDKNYYIFVYTNVQLAIANKIAEKLGQNLIKISL